MFMIKKILIVEDDSSLRELYKIKMEDEGFEVDTAKDGEEGVEKIRENKPDLVLLDLMMPRKNGFSVLEEVKGDNSCCTIPIIALSNLNSGNDINLVKKLGAIEYLVKSKTSLSNLVNIVKQNV